MTAVSRVGPINGSGRAVARRPQGAHAGKRTPVQAGNLAKKQEVKPIDKKVWEIFNRAATHLAEMDTVYEDTALAEYAADFQQAVRGVASTKTKKGAIRYPGVPREVSEQITKILGLLQKKKIPATDPLASAYPGYVFWKQEGAHLQELLKNVQPPTSCGDMCVIL